MRHKWEHALNYICYYYYLQDDKTKFNISFKLGHLLGEIIPFEIIIEMQKCQPR